MLICCNQFHNIHKSYRDICELFLNKTGKQMRPPLLPSFLFSSFPHQGDRCSHSFPKPTLPPVSLIPSPPSSCWYSCYRWVRLGFLLLLSWRLPQASRNFFEASSPARWFCPGKGTGWCPQFLLERHCLLARIISMFRNLCPSKHMCDQVTHWYLAKQASSGGQISKMGWQNCIPSRGSRAELISLHFLAFKGYPCSLAPGSRLLLPLLPSLQLLLVCIFFVCFFFLNAWVHTWASAILFSTTRYRWEIRGSLVFTANGNLLVSSSVTHSNILFSFCASKSEVTPKVKVKSKWNEIGSADFSSRRNRQGKLVILIGKYSISLRC